MLTNKKHYNTPDLKVNFEYLAISKINEMKDMQQKDLQQKINKNRAKPAHMRKNEYDIRRKYRAVKYFKVFAEDIWYVCFSLFDYFETISLIRHSVSEELLNLFRKEVDKISNNSITLYKSYNKNIINEDNYIKNIMAEVYTRLGNIHILLIELIDQILHSCNLNDIKIFVFKNQKLCLQTDGIVSDSINKSFIEKFRNLLKESKTNVHDKNKIIKIQKIVDIIYLQFNRAKHILIQKNLLKRALTLNKFKKIIKYFNYFLKKRSFLEI